MPRALNLVWLALVLVVLVVLAQSLGVFNIPLPDEFRVPSPFGQAPEGAAQTTPIVPPPTIFTGPAATSPVPSNACIAAGPRFVHGIAALKAGVGSSMGEPVECERIVDAVGDTEQRTTTDLPTIEPAVTLQRLRMAGSTGLLRRLGLSTGWVMILSRARDTTYALERVERGFVLWARCMKLRGFDGIVDRKRRQTVDPGSRTDRVRQCSIRPKTADNAVSSKQVLNVVLQTAQTVLAGNADDGRRHMEVHSLYDTVVVGARFGSSPPPCSWPGRAAASLYALTPAFRTTPSPSTMSVSRASAQTDRVFRSRQNLFTKSRTSAGHGKQEEKR